MSRQEIVALKLQMGISPSANIPSNVLLAMWQQLKLECDGELRNQSQADSIPNQMIFSPIEV